MENKVTLSDVVRENIPVVLKDSKHPLTEKELLEELAKKIPELVKNGEYRNGVLRGVLNKLSTQPVNRLGISREGNRVKYYFITDKKTELQNVFRNLISEIKEKELLTVDYLNDSPETIDFLKDVSTHIKDLEEFTR
ncbi:hypothetical protein [Bacillus velezensis]|uniref:hypothetical protein n=1 Tax=Bacillus velezensis TaxID=492670 RepID=UPI003453E426